MLKIYGVARSVVRRMAPVCAAIERHDTDLARQARRAAASVLLNMREGSSSTGRNRHARYATAAGSMNEVLGVLDAAEDLGYVGPVDEATRRDAACVIAALHRIVVGR